MTTSPGPDPVDDPTPTARLDVARRNAACPTCEAEGPAAFVGEVVGYARGWSYSVLECSACGTQRAEVLVGPDDLTELYDAVYEQASSLTGYARYDAYAKFVDDAAHPLHFLATSEPAYWAVQSIIDERRSASLGTTTLEVGCGLGYLTASLRKIGITAHGVDRSERAVAAATQRYGPWFVAGNAEDEITSEPADVIVALELVEHLNNPREFVSSLVGMLRPGGELVLSTPNRSEFSPDVLWSTDLPPVHLHWFTEQAMRSLAPEGVHVELFDFTSFNQALGPRRGLRTRPGPSEPFLDEDLRVLDPVTVDLDVTAGRLRHRPAALPLLQLLGAAKSRLRQAREILRPATRNDDVNAARSNTIVARYRRLDS